MPARTHMVVDPRRDHSFRVPRPDLSVTLGTPNACAGCHRDRPPQWAADRVLAWRGPAPPARAPLRAGALDAARRGLPEAGPALVTLATDRAQPGIARATALAHLSDVPARGRRRPRWKARSGIRTPSSAWARSGRPRRSRAERRGPLAAPLLQDPVRAVRLAAAHVAGRRALPEAQKGDLERALAEWIRSEQVNADRPEAHLNLAGLYGRRGRPADAESALRTALLLDPRFVPALVNLADLLRVQRRDADGERFLEDALRVDPDHPEALHALGLLRVRQNRVCPRRSTSCGGPPRAAPSPRASPTCTPWRSTTRGAPARPSRSSRPPTGGGRRTARPWPRSPRMSPSEATSKSGARVRASGSLALDPDDPAARTLVETLRRRMR